MNAHLRQDGSVLVAVLWLLGLLALLAMVMTAHVARGLAAIDAEGDLVAGDALAEAAVELVAGMVRQADRPLLGAGQFSGIAGKGYIRARFAPEMARIDINFASPELLAGLFRALGESAVDADALGQSIALLRAKAKPPSADPDAAAAVPPLFAQPDGLAMVPGVSASLAARALPHITTYSGSPQIDAGLAGPHVLAALPGMTEPRLRELLRLRALGGTEWKTALGDAQAFVTDDAGRALRIEIDAALPGGHHARVETVVLFYARDTRPYRVLSWRRLSGGLPR